MKIEFSDKVAQLALCLESLQNYAAGRGSEIVVHASRPGHDRHAQRQDVGPLVLLPTAAFALRCLAARAHRGIAGRKPGSLGYRETKEQLLRVFDVLGKLVTLQLSPKNLGGPLMIAAVAGSEASQGIPRLLIFLTFLSANLAILNFLPIPALDGGHMMFLTAEAVTGKPVDERLQGTLTLIGVVCLLGLDDFRLRQRHRPAVSVMLLMGSSLARRSRASDAGEAGIARNTTDQMQVRHAVRREIHLAACTRSSSTIWPGPRHGTASACHGDIASEQLRLTERFDREPLR